MRVAFFLLSVVVLALAGYIAVSGWFLARAATDILRVGQLAATLREAEPPTDPFTIGYQGNPMLALNLPFSVVPVETPLGPAEAWLVPATGTEVGRAVYVHGIAGLREDGYRFLATLNAAGWSVLMISYRNDANAPTTPEGNYGMGLLEWPDLEAAVAAFSPGPDGPDLLVVADSMGAAILGQFLMQSDLADRIGSVALDSPALSFSAVVGHLAEETGPLATARAWIAMSLLPGMTGLQLAEAEVTDAFTAFPRPVFVAHGSGDRIVPDGPSRTMAEARGAPTNTLWTNADHLGSFAEDPDTYRKALTGFLESLTQ